MSLTVAPLAARSEPAAPPDRAKVAEVARQFEAIFVRQILATARTSGFGDALGQGPGSQTFRQMRDDHFAGIAAQHSMLGLADAIEAQLMRQTPVTGKD